MATLPQLQGGRVQVAGVPNVVLPEVRFGQRNVSAAYQEQAQYQQAMGQVIDRMTQTVFGMAAEMSERAGLQFAAANPLTAEQLEAMSRGDMSQVDLGSPLNVFNSAVRKARAIELSGHAEIEMRQQMVELLEKADMGEMDADQVYEQITALSNGYGESLARVDPDAAYRFRATAATIGGRVIEKVAELDGKKRLLANTVKVQRDYTNMQKMIALAATSKLPINPATGREWEMDTFIDAVKTNFLASAEQLVGATNAAGYLASIDADIATTKVNSITQYLNTDPGFANNPGAFARLARGDAGSASNAFNSLLPEDRERVAAALSTTQARNYSAQQKANAQAAAAQEKSWNSLTLRLGLALRIGDDEIARQIKAEMIDHPALTADRLSDVDEGRVSDPKGFADLKSEIDNGLIQTTQELEERARFYKVYYDDGKLGNLRQDFDTLYGVGGTYVREQINVAANIPPGMYVSPTDDPRGVKRAKLINEFNQVRIEAFRSGEPFNAKQTVDDIARRALEERNSNAAETAKKLLAVFEETLGRQITLENFPALKYAVESGKETRISKPDLDIIMNQLKAIEGVQ